MSTRHYPPETRAAAVADYEAGSSCAAIGARRGIATSTVDGWVRRAGLTRSMSDAKRLETERLSGADILTDGDWVLSPRRVQVWQPERKTA